MDIEGRYHRWRVMAEINNAVEILRHECSVEIATAAIDSEGELLTSDCSSNPLECNMTSDISIEFVSPEKETVFVRQRLFRENEVLPELLSEEIYPKSESFLLPFDSSIGDEELMPDVTIETASEESEDADWKVPADVGLTPEVTLEYFSDSLECLKVQDVECVPTNIATLPTKTELFKGSHKLSEKHLWLTSSGRLTQDSDLRSEKSVWVSCPENLEVADLPSNKWLTPTGNLIPNSTGLRSEKSLWMTSSGHFMENNYSRSETNLWLTSSGSLTKTPSPSLPTMDPSRITSKIEAEFTNDITTYCSVSVQKSPQIHKCPFCINTFSTQIQRNEHLLEHRDDYKCRYCLMKFQVFHELLYHLVLKLCRRTEDYSYQCPICFARMKDMNYQSVVQHTCNFHPHYVIDVGHGIQY